MRCAVADRLQWTDELHAHVEWVYDLGHEHGFDAGLRVASTAMDSAIVEALGGPHSYMANTPVSPSAREVVGRMVRAMTRAAISRRTADINASAVRDQCGGPVPVWEVDE